MFAKIANFQSIPYIIPNLAEENIAAAFNLFIDRQEQEMLRKLLGGDLYQSFMEGLYSDVALLTARPEEEIEQRWKDLRDGAAYSYRLHPYRWFGMADLFTPYLYSMWVRFDNGHLGTNGYALSIQENSKQMNPSGVIAREYNNFSRKAGDRLHQQDTLYGFIICKQDVDGSLTFDGTFDESFGSLQQYLSLNYKAPKRINEFGI